MKPTQPRYASCPVATSVLLARPSVTIQNDRTSCQAHALTSTIERAHKNERGFTVIELVVVVGIIGILAAIAIPSYGRLQLKARRAEVTLNLKAIASAEVAYAHQYDEYVNCGLSPASTPGRSARAFDAGAEGWSELGWIPDGMVRCSYSAVRESLSRGEWVRIEGACDLDADGQTATWRVDVDPLRLASDSQHLVVRADEVTSTQDRY